MVPCDKHLKELVKYCKSCDEFVCKKCRDHKKHDKIEIEEYFVEVRENSRYRVRQFQCDLNQLRRDIKLEEFRYRNEVEDQYQRQMRLLDREVRDLVDEIHVKHLELKRELKSFYEENNEIYTTKISKYHYDLENATLFIQQYAGISDESSEKSKLEAIKSYKQLVNYQIYSTNREKKSTYYHQYQVNFNTFDEAKEKIQMIHPFSYISESNKLTMSSDPIQMPDGKKMGKKELLVKSIELDPDYSINYFTLANLMDNYEVVQLNDGSHLDRKQLYIKAIDRYWKSNDQQSNICTRNYFLNLGVSLMHTDDIVILPNEERMNQKQLYLKSIEIDPLNYSSYNCLAFNCKPGEQIQLLDGRKLTRRELYLESIRSFSSCPETYSNLALELSNDDTVELPDGRVLNRISLNMESIKLDPNNYIPYKNLTLCL